MESLLSELEAREPSYTPNTEVATALSGTTLAPLIGPSAVGKSTLIESVITVDQEFTRSASFTTRPWRPEEPADQYQFLDHNTDNLSDLLAKVRKQEIVQYAVHPFTKHIYGSEIDAYASPFVVLDALASAVESLRALPFRSVVEVGLVCVPEVWKHRFKPRRANESEALKRIDEGVSSLVWCLDQGNDIAWVDNSSPIVERTAEHLVGIVRGTIEPDPSNRTTGEQLLAYIKSLR